VSEHLDVGSPSLKNPSQPRVLLVEHPSADRAERWHRALEILLAAGPPHPEDEADGE
jgi:hypothetical protein